MKLKNEIETIISEIHQFFQDWFNGNLPQSEDYLTRALEVLSPGFTMINPGGILLRKDTLIQNIQRAHNSNHSIRIWIENPAVIHEVGDITISTYEEWQEIDGIVTTRLSSAFFQKVPDTPGGIQWIHLQETWVKG